MTKTLWLALLLIALFAGPPPAPAQETTATITGVVTDQTGAALPGTGVIARSISQGFVKEAVTAVSGAYTVPFLPVGEYEVTFTLSGFQTFVARSIRLHVNDRLTLNVALRVEGQQETVDVTAAAQLIQPTGAVQSLMGPTQVQELPLNNRNFVQLATLVPGVTSSLSDEVGIGLTSTVSVSIAGARRNAVNWFVDGASNVDVGSNITLLSTPTLESIEEFKIITSGLQRGVAAQRRRHRQRGHEVGQQQASGPAPTSSSATTPSNANSFFRKQSTDPAIRDNPPRLRYRQLRLHPRRPRDEGQALLLLVAGVAHDLARPRFGGRPGARSRPGSTDPTNANYVAPAQRDPNAVKLLSGWPAPNLGSTGFQDTRPNEQDTRQEVLRLDFQIAPSWRLMARYTHDLERDHRSGRPLLQHRDPRHRHHAHRRARATWRWPSSPPRSAPRMLNELSLQFSGNAIKSTYGDNVRNTRERVRPHHPGALPENREGLIPQVAITGLSSIGATQLFDNTLPELHGGGQPLLPERQPRLEGRRPRRLRAEGRDLAPASPRAASASPPAEASPPSRTSCAATRTEPAARPAPTAKPSARSTAACASRATSSTSRTPGK